MGLTRTQLREALQILAAEHPAAHPYTLAVLLEARTGTKISAELELPPTRLARKWLVKGLLDLEAGRI